MKRIMFLLATLALAFATMGQVPQSGVFIGELIAYRVDTTLVDNNIEVRRLLVATHPTWTMYAISTNGVLTYVIGRIEYGSGFYCAIGVPAYDRGVPVTQFYIRDCEVFYTFNALLNKIHGTKYAERAPPVDITKIN